MLKLGRNRSPDDLRTLQFRDYITAAAAPTPPAVSNWYNEVWRWLMYGNDTTGDCTIAGLAHQWNTWTKYATGVLGGPTTAQVEALYKILSPDDTGCDMLTALRHISKAGKGFPGDSLAAYAAINVSDRFELETAISLFGGVYLGLSLPNAVTNGLSIGEIIPWVIPADATTDMADWIPNPNNGHAVVAVGYNQPTDTLYPITWGRRIVMSWQWCNTYVDEAYVLVSEQWIKKNGDTPSGVNLAKMLADVASISSGGSASPLIMPPG